MDVFNRHPDDHSQVNRQIHFGLRHRLRASGFATALLWLAGCDSYDARSTLQVHLTATPAKGIDSVQLRVSQVQVHVVAEEQKSAAVGDKTIDDDGAWQTLEVNRTLGLGSATAAIQDLGMLRLTEGWIDQLRIGVASPTTALAAGKSCALVVALLPKDGVKISSAFRPFPVRHALDHAIWLDLRLDQALTKSGDCWSLGPVLEVERFTTGGKDVSVQ
jgi:hypothetical protein